MKNINRVAIVIVCWAGLWMASLGNKAARADVVNPCQYIDLQNNTMKQMPTGNDPNWQRIYEQNNRDMIRACQEYEIKALRQATSNVY